jgi:hypothetical protein
VLNDNFRSSFVGGQVVMTQGVKALPLDTKARVLLAAQSFSSRRKMTLTASTTFRFRRAELSSSTK